MATMSRTIARIVLTFILVSNCVGSKISTENDDGKSSLVFVFDTTGSMHDDLKQLREGAEMILNTAINESNIIADFVFVPFHDPAVGPATVTRDKQQFQQALNIIDVYGGGDCPEKSLSGILMALKVSRPRSFVYVFTDATASDHRFVGKVLDSVQRKQIQVVFVLTGHCNDLDRPTFKVYQQIAAASSGQVFNLNKTSVHKVLEFVRTSIKARSVNLGSIVNTAGYNFTKEVPVDSTLGEVTVSVSGSKPQIKVVNPRGEELTGPPKLVKTLDLSEIMVVKVLQPEPGNWRITVGSEEDYSVKVVGLSNLTFNHGFSVEKPASMAETSYRPLRGTYNNMLIKLTQTDIPVEVSYAEILNLSGKTLFEVPLKEVDRENKVYLADAFMPPDEFFYIAINGRDQYNQELRRTGATAVQAKLPDVPYLTALRKMDVRPHQRVVLICNVESLVPVTSMWTKDSVRIQPEMSSLQTTSIEYAIEDMSEVHVGTYVCSAKNVAGQSRTATEVVLLVDPPQVTIEPINTTLELGEDLTISCKIVSEALLLKYRMIFNDMDLNIGTDNRLEPDLEGVYVINKTIERVNESNTGLYTCIVANRGGQTNQSTYVQIKSQPIIHILGSHTLTVPIHTDIQIICEVENADIVRWVAPNNTIVKEYSITNSRSGKQKAILNMKNVSANGVWQCMGFRGSYSDSDSVEINIVTKPKVSIEGGKNITIVNGTTHVILCFVEATPAPKILWRQETEENLNHSVKQLKPDYYKSILTLNSSKKDVEGTYICMGENSQGIDQDSITVNVRRKMTLVIGFTDTSVELYYQVELYCRVDSYPPPRVHWYHNGTELHENNNLHLSNDNTTVYVKKVEFDNLGFYMCEAENGFESIRVNGTLSVHGLEIPTISKESSRHVAQKGLPTIITCSVRGNPEPRITWRYRDRSSGNYASLPRGVTVNDFEELSISNVALEHSGTYRCFADNILGRDELDTELLVNYPPELLLEEDSIDDDAPREVEVGGNEQFSCKAVGSPPPMITWTKNGYPVIYTKNFFTFQILTDENALVLKNATAKDAGVFTCKAISALGSSERNFTLVVYMAPKITTSNIVPQREVLEGQLVELPCSVEGVPSPIVTWRQDSNIIEERRKYTDEFGLRFVANLSDSGSYSCTAVNERGIISLIYTLSILVPPSIEPIESSIKVLNGTDVTIVCKADGSPTPTIVWEFQKEVIKENTSHVSFNDQGILFIKNANSELEGKYTCVAKNKAGVASQTTRLIINDPPELPLEEDSIDGDEPREVQVGEKVQFSCKAVGSPPPLITWTKNGNPVVYTKNLHLSDTSALVLENATAKDAGVFTCKAISASGSSERNFTLVVYMAPKITTSNIKPQREILEGQLVELLCSVEGVPSPIVTWRHDGNIIKERRKYIDEIGLRFIANLSDSGNYSCTAANEHGITSLTYTLTVWVPPSIEHLEPSKKVLKGKNVMIECKAVGFPTPTIVWEFRKEVLKENTSHLSFTDQGAISIKNANSELEGNYTCVAKSRAGVASQSTRLIVNDPPELSLGEESINDDAPREVEVGRREQFSCKAVGSPPPMITWTKNGYPVIYTKNLHLTDANELVLENATAEDTGVFTCKAISASGSTERNFTLVVYMAPKITTSNIEPHREVLEGQLVELPCSVEGVPSPIVTWRQDGNIIEERRKYIDEFGLRFVANLSDSGSYSCTAGNERGITSIIYMLSVWVPPSIEPLESSKKVLNGTNVTIKCIAVGVPVPTIVWEFQEQVLNKNTSNVSFNDQGVLFIKNVNSELEGNYTCVAKNNAGVARQSIRLIINEEDSVDNTEPREAEVGDKVKFSCKPVGSSPSIITWSKNGYPVVYTKNLHLTDANDLVLENATAKDAGVFTCKAKNVLGSSERNFPLVVYMRPIITTPNIERQREVLEGQLVELPCSVEGFPTPVVTWKQDDNIIEDKRKYIDEFGLRFVANLSDFGNYSCTASNEHGITSLNYTLSVWVAPYIEALDSLTEVVKGSNVTIECNAVGFPIPSILWEYQQELLNENTSYISFNEQGVLYINNASSELEGVYSCVAENNAGVASQSTRLIINEPPKILSDNYTGSYLATDMDTALTITCQTTGKPKPYVVWSKDDFYLARDSRYIIDVDGSLTINSPTEDLSGAYTCTAKNSAGVVNKTVTVEIYSLPTTMQSDESHSSISVLEGTDIRIRCPAQATNKATINWYKDAKLISQRYLAISNVSRNNASTFACVVKNAIGSAYSTIKLNVEWPPIFLMNGTRDIEVVRGDDRYLDCGVDAKPTAKTRWLFNSEPILFADKARLKLMNVQLHNTGIYKCVVSNIHGTVVKQFMLDVSVPPFISDFDLLDVQLKEGTDATLECNARGSPEPSVTWTFNNKYWQIQNATLTAIHVTSKSEGLYRCDAHNKAGSTHIVYRVTVVSGAKITEVVSFSGGEGATVDESVVAVLGTHLRVSCKATGEPRPDIQWIRNGILISRNSKNIDYADLVFTDVQTSNAGLYSCVASNEGSSDDWRVKIDVLEPPKIFQNLFESPQNDNIINLEVISGQAFYLHCHPYGNPMPEVYWFRDDMPLKLFDETMVSSEFGEVLTTKSAMFEQSGNYTCVARNSVGNSSIVYLVDVLVPPPSLKESSKKVSTRMGKSLSLKCPIQGSPTPYAMWVKHPYIEISANTPRVQLLNDNYTLIINDTEISDSGRYSCILTNKVGTTEYTFNVTIRKPPTIAGNVPGNNVEDHVVPLRRSIVLKCETDGNPLPTISWLKDTQQLSDNLSNIQRVLGNSMLAIRSMSERDAGQYICVVESEAGSAHRRYNVAVQVPGKWGPWSPWSTCNVTCGVGSQIKYRNCYYIDDDNNTIDKTSQSEKIVIDESGCGGPPSDKRKCHMPRCEDESKSSHWSVWSKWSSCSASCGVGTQSRTRQCKDSKCTEDNVQLRKCPDLPKCLPQDPSENEVYSSGEANENDTYLPEATFEMQPDIRNSHSPSDVEEFYVPNVIKKPPVYFDVSVTENLDQSERGPCKPGFRHNVNENVCNDIDECLIEINQCHSTQVCVNTEGAYRCTCQTGYVSLGAGQRCLDVNECSQELHGCQFACVNVAGGYVCACPRGLRLHADKHRCYKPPSYQKTYGNSYDDLETEVY